MDINCTNICIYQDNGKCTLHKLPSLTQSAYNGGVSDCPYCENP